jgi:hypothetical protein
VPHLRNLNMCLLASWVQRYYDGENKVWRNIIDSKYQLAPNVFSSNPRNASPFGKGVKWVAYAAKMGYRWKVGDGSKIRFWEDNWFETCSLAIRY